MAYRETAQIRTRKQSQRLDILAAARTRIATAGYQNAQMQALAQDCNIATGAVYRYFPSKAQLFAEVFRQAVQIEVDAVDKAARSAATPSAQLQAIIQTFVERALRAPRLAYALLAEPVDPLVEQERLVFRRSYAQVIEQVIRTGIADQSFVTQHPGLSAAALVGVLNETLVGPLSPGIDARIRTHAEPADLTQSIIALCLRAVTA